MNADRKIRDWYSSLPKNYKTSFYATIIIGLICHAFMMTNKWLNLDDIVQLVDTMDRTTSGRWFLMFPSALGSEFSLPWLNGLLTILYSGIMAATIVAMFNIKSRISSILIGGILVTFPTIGSLMPFMNTQDSYQFGAMLAVFAAYLLAKERLGFLPATLLLTLSLGIYQTYLGLAAGLLLVYLIIRIFEGVWTVKEILIFIGKMAIAFVGSLAIYLFVSRVIFGHLLVSYKGLDTMGSLPLSQLPQIVFSAYKAMFDFFTGQEFDYHWVFMPILFVIAILVIFYIIFYLVKKEKVQGPRLYILLAILAFFPAVINVIYIMSWQDGVMLRMAYSYVVCFIMPLVLIDYMNLEEEHLRIKKRSLANYGAWFLVITLMLSVYNNVYVTNKVYFKVWITNKTSDAYGNRISMRLEMADGYTTKTPIMFLGNPDSRTSFTNEIDTDDTKPFIIANHLTRLYSFKYYPKRFLGLPNTIYDEDHITAELEPYRDEIEQMPLYPHKDSIKLIDGTLYIKFKDIE